MTAKYTPEQVEQILQKLPPELKEMMFSLETADNVGEICNRYGVTNERVTEIAKYAGYVLMGLIMPSEFPQLVEKEIKVPKKIAQELAREINRFVFYPVKPALEQLHSMEVGTRAKERSGEEATPTEEMAQQVEQKVPGTPRKEDSYRESIE